MLKKRICATVLYRGEQAFKGVGFDSWRPIGHVKTVTSVFMRREIDELFLLDIDAACRGAGPDFARLKDLCGADDPNISTPPPITYGGGIRSLDDIRQALASGADKVTLGTIALERPGFVKEAAEKFGAQCVVIAADCRHGRIWSHCGTKETNIDAQVWCEAAEHLGCGEILLTSIPHDGAMEGFDLPLIARISSAVSVPTIAAGGAGSYRHLAQAFAAGASAVSASALWAFTDCVPAGAAEYLHSQGIPVRRKIAA